jgi:hypothetical protein
MSTDLILYKKNYDDGKLYNMPSTDVRSLYSASQDEILKAYFNYVEELLLSEEQENVKNEPNNLYHKQNLEFQKEIFDKHKKTVIMLMSQGYTFIIDG